MFRPLRLPSFGLLAVAGAAVVVQFASSASPRPLTTTSSQTLHVVALGDSDASGNGDPTGQGWVGRYGRLLGDRLGVKVVLTNLAQEGQTSAELLSSVRSDTHPRGLL